MLKVSLIHSGGAKQTADINNPVGVVFTEYRISAKHSISYLKVDANRIITKAHGSEMSILRARIYAYFPGQLHTASDDSGMEFISIQQL